MANFSLLFWLSLGLCSLITFRSSDLYKKQTNTTTANDGLSDEVKKVHTALLKKYLFVYLMATLSDWLQGPYVYALYSEYGFEQHHIAQLFVAGFGSSMIFGSFVGGMADWGGRRLFVIIFALVYAASCMTKRKSDGEKERKYNNDRYHIIISNHIAFVSLIFIIISLFIQTSRITMY